MKKQKSWFDAITIYNTWDGLEMAIFSKLNTISNCCSELTVHVTFIFRVQNSSIEYMPNAPFIAYDQYPTKFR